MCELTATQLTMAKGRKNQTWIKNVKRNVRIVVEEEELIVCITVSQNGWKIEGSSNIVQMFDSERFSWKYTAFYHSQQNSRISPLGLGNMKHANIACLGFGKGKHALKEKHITYIRIQRWPSLDSDARLHCSGKIFVGLHMFE